MNHLWNKWDAGVSLLSNWYYNPKAIVIRSFCYRGVSLWFWQTMNPGATTILSPWVSSNDFNSYHSRPKWMNLSKPLRKLLLLPLQVVGKVKTKSDQCGYEALLRSIPSLPFSKNIHLISNPNVVWHLWLERQKQ